MKHELHKLTRINLSSKELKKFVLIRAIRVQNINQSFIKYLKIN
jgi:hypothetical protein